MTSNGYWIVYKDHNDNVISREYVKDKMEIVIQSRFVKAHQDVEEGDICTIKTEGIFTDTPDKKKKVYQFELELGSYRIFQSTNNPHSKYLVD